MLSPSEIKKLEKLAKVGDIGIADELNALEGRLEGLEAIVPVLREARDGEDGYTPVKGVDYFDGKDGYTPIKGVDYFDGERGADGRDGKDSTVPGPKGDTGPIGPPGSPGKDGKDGFVDEATVAYLEEEVKKAKLDTEEFNRALGIVDQRTSFLINRVNNLPTTGGVSAFTSLTDVPNSYTGQATKVLRVKAGEDGLEFATNSATVSWGGITGTLSAQTDLQSALDGKANSLGADDNYVTDAEKVKLSNLSGTNTGDQVIPDQLSDLADDSTHRLVTDAEKSTWNAKQSALTADVDYLTPTTAGTTYEPKKGTDDNFVTDAEKVVIGNTSGTNTGDNAVNTLYSGLATSKVDANGAITGATKTKITYDTKGLVTAGADATTADIADSLNKRYVTDANLTTIGNQSGTNTGDETTATIKTKLGITTLSGSNTGDQTSIVGITGTKAQFNTAVTDGDFLYVGDVTTNATHTGEVTGSGALTLDATAITNKTLVTAVGTDYVLISDTSDSGLLKKALASDLAGAGGSTNLSYTPATRVIASDTGTDATLPLVSSADAGLAPASGGGTSNFLRADGTWTTPAGGSASYVHLVMYGGYI